MYTRDMPRVKDFFVIVKVYDTGEYLTGPRIISARTGQEAGERMSEWLDLEGFDITAKIEVGRYVGNMDD